MSDVTIRTDHSEIKNLEWICSWFWDKEEKRVCTMSPVEEKDVPKEVLEAFKKGK